MAEDFTIIIISVSNAVNYLFGNYEDVGRGFRIEVVNSDTKIVLVFNFGWDIPGDYLFEYSFPHHTCTI